MSDQETYNRAAGTGRAPLPEAATESPNIPAPPTPLPDEPYYRQAAPSKGSRGGMSVGMALILVGLLWLAFTVGRGTLFGSGLTRTTLVDQTLPGSRVELDAGSADVNIRPWDKAGVHVQVFQQGGSAEDYVVDVRESDGTVYVTGTSNTGFCFFCWRSLTFEVRVPEGAQASVRSSSGDISAEEVNGPVSFNTSSGDVQASELVGDATISTSSGEVRLNDVSGKLEVSTGSGDVKLDDGDVSEAAVSTISGDVKLEGVAKTIKVESVSGDITVSDARDGQLTLSTTSGDIDYEGSLDGGASHVTTISGDVKLRLPDDSSFRLEASTVSGDLSSEFDLRDGQQGRRSLSGTAGDGAATLQIETTSGDVNVER